MSVSVVSKILRLFVHTLTPGDKHSVDNREILKQPIQIQLSQALKVFSQFLPAFLKSPFNFEHFEKRDEPHSLCISEIIYGERHACVNV